MLNRIVHGLTPKRFSLILLIINVLTGYFGQRKGSIHKLLTQDAQGYYQYLPGLFIDKDIKHLPWAHLLENGNHISVFNYGVAFLEAPFFLIGHLLANLLGYETDGYSLPYSYSILFGTIFYVSIGFYFLFKFLEKRFERKHILLALTILFFGTNLYFYTTLSAGYSHAYTFVLFSLFLYFTDRYFSSPSYKFALIIGILSGIILVIKPNNLIISVLFILYGISSWSEFKLRVQFFLKQWRHVLTILIPILGFAFIQMLYWKTVADKWLTFSYGEKEESFNWTQFKLLEVLGHPQNGWFLYSPVIMFAVGFLIYGVLKKRSNYRVIGTILLISWYIFSSWWCWYFGAAFGHRAFVEYLALLSLPMVLFIETICKTQKKIRIAVGSIVLIFVFMSIRMTFLYQWPWDGPDWYWDDYFEILERVFFLK